MAVEQNTVAALLEKLKVDDPWIPPKPWESISSESGSSQNPSTSHSQSSHSLYRTANISESSLVRLALNALQGVESALVAVDKLSALFCSDSADRTFHRISSLWTRSSSTGALGNLLKSIGQFGCVIFLLQKFVLYFTRLKLDGDSGSEETLEKTNKERKEQQKCKFSVVNQAFAVAVKKILDGYISALNTLCASVNLRRNLKNTDGGCLANIGNSEITLMEVHLHTQGLRTQIEALGNICQICDIAYCFSVSTFEDLSLKADLKYTTFPRGGTLLTFLYTQLKVVDPVHFALLEFLFLQSFEPYYHFIRSWIYGGKMSDPYKEFVMEYVDHLPPSDAQGNTGIFIEFPSSTVRVRDGVTLPCFLEDFLVPLLRAGQQLQVVMKLLEFCYNLGTNNNAQVEILPFLENFPNEFQSHASPLTFHKGNIGKLVLARNSYYKRMLEKVESFLTKFEFRSQKASLYRSQFFFANLKHAESMLDDSFVPTDEAERDQNLPVNVIDNEASSADEFSCAEDLLESSESLSVHSSEEQNDSYQTFCGNLEFQPSYLSSLSFSFSSSSEKSLSKCSQSGISCSKDNFLSEICERTEEACCGMDAYHERKSIIGSSFPIQFGEWNLLLNADTKTISAEHDACPRVGRLSDCLPYLNRGNSNSTWFKTTGSELEVRNGEHGGLKLGMLKSSYSTCTGNALIDANNNKHQLPDRKFSLSNSLRPQSWNSRYSSNFLSMNPTLSKGFLINSCNKPGERLLDYRKPLCYFDFASVKDPCKVCEEKLTSSSKYQFGHECSISNNTVADTAFINASAYHGKENCSHEDAEKMIKTSQVSSDPETYRGEDALCTKITGGSKWETLLACFGNAAEITDRGYRTYSMAEFDMPSDYVIKKCLGEEILLQYQFVSKLTLKLLEEGFDLQEHLLALRRYHFMELADWADLFIMSLWHRKWHVAEADKRILEIQGVLELSVQRSSCEGDINKDRLYVYMKGHPMMPLSASVNGIHSFDFLGLGYRVDWPISIILTPDALKIYSNIFSFLIQVKLAVFSLSDVWCKLKDLVHLSVRNEPTLRHISLLIETRHQVNHFISTLQQYVQSKLSHVSWCKFTNSLKYKVKDMVDLEAVHMEYLTESLHICFLSDDARSIANIIQSILQCAVDFRSCMIGCTLEVRPSGKDSSELPEIDIVQVLAIKRTFKKNLEDLYLYYLKSPKHSEIGLSNFWDYLNCNDYYTENISKQLGHSFLSI